MDLTKYELPACVIVDGEKYPIITDFRWWIIFSRIVKKENISLKSFDFLYKENNAPSDRTAGLEELIKFYAPPHTLPRVDKDNKPQGSVLDYDLDSDLIYSAFYQQYGIDLISVDLHWHKFLALLGGLRETKLTDVFGYRLWQDEGKNDSYSKYMRQQQSSWVLEEAEDENEIADALAKYNAWEKGERK